MAENPENADYIAKCGHERYNLRPDTLGGIGGRRRRGQQRMRWLDGITDSMDMSLSATPGVGDGQGGLACCDSWGRRVRHN